ncbi:hypothetical protein [Bacillus infantis]|uniref:hypothetical protein n=1 Tax=Bacillus infantis TaxID=324767 RepID=UPI003CE695F2
MRTYNFITVKSNKFLKDEHTFHFSITGKEIELFEDENKMIFKYDLDNFINYSNKNLSDFIEEKVEFTIEGERLKSNLPKFHITSAYELDNALHLEMTPVPPTIVAGKGNMVRYI